MEAIELRLQRCEEDIKELKKYKDNCTEKSHKTELDLATAIQKMNDLIVKVEELPGTLEKIISSQMELQAKENKNIYTKIANIEINQKKINEKVESLEKLIDERTVEEDSKNYKKIAMEIILGIVGFIVAFGMGKIFK